MNDNVKDTIVRHFLFKAVSSLVKNTFDNKVNFSG